MLDLSKIMKQLANKRPLFTSEADFQFALAWEIKSEYEDCNVYLEFIPEYDRNVHIDILVEKDGKYIPIELKYKTRYTDKIIHNGICFQLKNQSAKDVNCYKYFYDVQRIEKFCEYYGQRVEEGYAIFITNDISYSKHPAKKGCVYAAFSLHEGRTVKGRLNWSEKASEGTKKGCEDLIDLKNEYSLHWECYSKINNSKYGTFISSILRVNLKRQ